MFCKFCGKKLNEENKFCNYCGSKLDYNNINQTKINKKTNKKNNNYIIVIVVIIVVCFLLKVINLTVSNNNPINGSVNNNVQSDKINTDFKKTYSKTDLIITENWQIKIEEVSDTKYIGNEYKNLSTAGNYVILKMKIKNISNEAKTPLTSSTKINSGNISILACTIFQLTNGVQIFDGDYNLDGYIDNNYDVLFEKINPNVEKDYIAVFEVDKKINEQNYSLIINDITPVTVKL